MPREKPRSVEGLGSTMALVTWAASCGLFLLLLLLAGCSSVSQTGWQRIDGTHCLTSKIKPVWYSSESETDCLQKDGKVVTVQTNHEDIGIVGYVAAAALGLAAAAS